MLKSFAWYETPNARKYLQQLCKHFAHKIAVDYSECHGECALPSGKVVMDASDNGLAFAIVAQDEEGLAQSRHIVESHLATFAFRENFESLEWQDRLAA